MIITILIALYIIIGLIASYFMIALDAAFSFDSSQKTWKDIFSDWRTYLMIFTVLTFWPIGLIILLISSIRSRFNF